MMRSCTRDELLADDVALLLGIGDAGQRVEETASSACSTVTPGHAAARNRSRPRASGRCRRRRRARARGPARAAEREGDGGIDAAADEEEDVARADGTRGSPARCSGTRCRGSQSCTQPQTPKDEVREVLACRARCGPPRGGTARRRACAPVSAMAATSQVPVRPAIVEALGQRGHRVAVAHPDLLRAGEPAEERVGERRPARGWRGRTRRARSCAPGRPEGAPSAAGRSRCRARAGRCGRWPDRPSGCPDRSTLRGPPEMMIPLANSQFGGGSFAGAHLGVDAELADLAGIR